MQSLLARGVSLIASPFALQELQVQGDNQAFKHLHSNLHASAAQNAQQRQDFQHQHALDQHQQKSLRNSLRASNKQVAHLTAARDDARFKQMQCRQELLHAKSGLQNARKQVCSLGVSILQRSTAAAVMQSLKNLQQLSILYIAWLNTTDCVQILSIMLHIKV